MNDKKQGEPFVIALATGKGGNMKTTSAVFLACALVDQSQGEQRALVADVLLQFFLSNFCTIFPQYGLPVSSRNCTI